MMGTSFLKEGICSRGYFTFNLFHKCSGVRHYYCFVVPLRVPVRRVPRYCNFNSLRV